MRKGNFLFFLSAVITALSLGILLASRKEADFASFLNSTLGARLRGSLLFLSNPVPFSVFELLLVLSPAFIFLIIYSFKNKEKAALHRRFLSCVSVFLLIFSLFINTLVVGYGVNIEAKSETVGEKELASALVYLSKNVNSIEIITFPDANLLSKKLFLAYRAVDFPELTIPDLKPNFKKIKNTRIASMLGILGSYSFLTSEINLNFSAPEYTIPFTAAHEMAHLFGISGEAEANLYAYRTSLLTGDDGIMYSAYLSAFEYVGNALSLENRELYLEIFSSLSEKAKRDIKEYRNFYLKNTNKITVGSDKINGELLDAVDKNGAAGYGEFTNLLVSYLISEGIL